jgi:hypothetical protein
MPDLKMSRRRPVLRMLLWVAALFAVSLALLTCTPPNFGDDPVADPLTITPLEPQMVAGSQLDFNADGGTPPYVFAVTSGTGLINSSSGLYTASDQPESAAVEVTDQKGRTTQTPVTIKPSALALSPNSVSIFQGTSIQITGSGGTLNYSTGSVNGGGVLTKTSDTTWNFTAGSLPGDIGDWAVTVSDSSIPVKNAFSYIHVNAVPGVLTISPDTITLTLNNTFTFSAGGGTPPYSFAMVSGGGSITSGGLYTASQVTPELTPDVVMVTDAALTTDTAEITVVTLPLQITPTFVNVQFNAGYDFNASGGKPPYVFSILTGGDSGLIVPGTGVYTAPATAGTVTVQVADSLPSTPSTALVNVYAPLVIAPDPATVDAGSTLTFTASGGVPGFTYALVSGVGSISAGGLYTAPASPGNAVVKVTDSIGNVDQTTVTVLDPADWAPAITVDTAGGQYASLVLTKPPSEWPNIAYRVGTATTTLKFAKWTGSAFEKATVTSAGDYPGQYASLALDADDNPRIGHYYSKPNHEGLGYAHWDGGWILDAKVPGTADDPIGQYASLALDPADGYNPRIACYKYNDGVLPLEQDLVYASYDGTSWTLLPVDTAGDVGQYASLALDVSGYPHIAYYDATNGDLRYAYENSGGWHYETPDNLGNVGQYASLALDGLGYPHFAYYDAGSQDLKYAWKDGGGWHGPQTVDMTGDVGQYASLALDGSGNPRIAYFDATNGDLKYASWNGSVWVIAAIDTSGTVGQYASLALTTSGKMRIAYYDATNGDLKYIAQQ